MATSRATWLAARLSAGPTLARGAVGRRGRGEAARFDAVAAGRRQRAVIGDHDLPGRGIIAEALKLAVDRQARVERRSGRGSSTTRLVVRRTVSATRPANSLAGVSTSCRLATYWTSVGVSWTGTRTVRSSLGDVGVAIVTACPALAVRAICAGSARLGRQRHQGRRRLAAAAKQPAERAAAERQRQGHRSDVL